MSIIQKTDPVEANALVAVVSPASTPQADRVERGLAALRALGYIPKPAENLLARGPLYFAGTPETRLRDLHHAFANDEVRAIFATRGGYGSNYLLEGLDLDLIAESAKPFVGYSDLTALQLWLLDQISLPAFHGPMLSADFARIAPDAGADSAAQQRSPGEPDSAPYPAASLGGIHQPSLRAALSGQPYSLGSAEGLRPLRNGKTRGTLYGGCLSILVAMLGTPYEPQTEGKLLFLEDVATKPYQIDRLLWQLQQAGKLEGVKGIVFGEMLDCVSPGASPDLLDEVILSALDDFKGPIAMGLRCGHVSGSNCTLLFGVEAELIVAAETKLHLREPAVKSLYP